MERLIVKERTDLERDTYNKAILSNNTIAYKNRLAIKKQILKKQDEIDELKNKVDQLESIVKTLVKKVDK
jgi:hypothetical protein